MRREVLTDISKSSASQLQTNSPNLFSERTDDRDLTRLELVNRPVFFSLDQILDHTTYQIDFGVVVKGSTFVDRLVETFHSEERDGKAEVDRF